MKILKTISDRLDTRGGIFLISLAIATIVWFGIRAITGYSARVTEIPVEIQPPPGWIVLDASVRTVDLSFLGTREDLRLLGRDLVKVSVDLRHHTDTAPCVHEFVPADVSAPGSPILDFAVPPKIVVRMDRQGTKQVPVRLETQNMLPAGYEQKAPVITPATVQLTGPESLLARIESVSTLPIDLDGRIRTFTRRAQRLVLPTDAAEHVRMDPPTATLEIPIVERSSNMRFDDVPVGLVCPPGQALQASVVPDVSSVTVKGPPELVDALSAGDVRLFVDAAGLGGPASQLRPIHADLPDRISLVQTDPPQARVQVTFGTLQPDE